MARASGSLPRKLDSVIGQVYDAAEDPELWTPLLESVATLLGSGSTNLITGFVGSDASNVSTYVRTDPCAVVQYVSHYAAVNVWAERMNAMFPAETIGYSHRAIPDRELRRTEFYAGWLKPNDLAYCIGAVIPLPNQPPALLTSLRSARQGPFDEMQGRLLGALAPHLRRALRIHCRLSTLQAERNGLETALDAYDRAVVGLSGSGSILFLNREAERLLQHGDGIAILRGRLVAELPGRDAALQAFLVRTGLTSVLAAEALLLDRSSGKPPLRLSLLPFAGRRTDFASGLATLVFLDDPVRAPRSRGAVLRRLYGLTPMEVRLADLLAAGVDLRSAGERLAMARETTRFHLRSIFRKMAVNRQTDLVRLVLSLPGALPTAIRKL